MAYASMLGGGSGADTSFIHADPSHPDYISVPDAALLFTGDYRRAGPDLVLTGQDGRHHLIPGYFASEHPPKLVAPNGASLTAEVVGLMAGPAAPQHFAQAQPAAPPDSIGKVEKSIGDVTAVRNGVAVALHVGDPVFKSDVIQTGASSTVGISFPDGTALNLVANTRMALNEFSYDPNSNSNSALMTLVEGTFAFVAGKVAHTGDMKIATPVATMGIRGTTGWVEEELNPPGTVTSTQGQVTYSFAVVNDFGVGTSGLYDLFVDGLLAMTVSRPGFKYFVTPRGVGLPPLVSVEPMTNADLAFEQDIIQGVFQTLNLLNPSPRSITPGSNGSGGQPFEAPLPPTPQLFENNNPPPNNGGNGGGGPQQAAAPQQPQTLSLPQPPVPTPTHVVVWIGPNGGDWTTPSNWSDDIPPVSGNVVEILNPGKVILDSAVVLTGLELVAGAILHIGPGGSLTIGGVIDGPGSIVLDSDSGDPSLPVNGALTLEGGGTLTMTGSGINQIIGVPSTGATLTNVDWTIAGNGSIGTGDGSLTLINRAAGKIEASGGKLVIDTGNAVINAGTMLAMGVGATLQVFDAVANTGAMKAQNGGTLEFDGIIVTNAGGTVSIDAQSAFILNSSAVVGGTVDNAGVMTVTGPSSVNGDVIDNSGTINVGAHASLFLEATTLTNETGATITASHGGSVTIEIANGDDATDHGTITALDGGVVTFEVESGARGGIYGSVIADDGTVNIGNNGHGGGGEPGGNFGTVKAVDGGTVNIRNGIDNQPGATIEAVDPGSQVNISGGNTENSGTLLATGTDATFNISDGSVDNSGAMTATDFGTMTLSSVMLTDEAGATVTASGGGLISYMTGGVDNFGTVKANGGTINFGGEIGITNETSGQFLATSDGTMTFGASSSGSVTNNGGSFWATTGGSITFEASLNGVTNENGGTIGAGTDGMVLIDAMPAAVMNTGGFIEADGTNATVELFGVTINGGTVESSDGGVIAAVSGVNDFFNVTLGAGTYVQTDDHLASTLVLQGTTTIDGTVTFEGGGIVEMDVASYQIVGGNAGGTLVNETTIQGTGTIGDGGGFILDNQSNGKINADVAQQTLTLYAATITNAGTLKVATDATMALELADGAMTNSAGILVDGTLAISTPGFDADTETLRGTGRVTLDHGLITFNSETFVNDGNTFSGTGQIGEGAVKFDNSSGTVEALGGTLLLYTYSLTNAATLGAVDGGTLLIESDVDNARGTISAEGSGSFVELENGITITAGTLSTDHSTLGSGGIIEVVDGPAATVFDGATSGAVTVAAFVEVEAGAALALKGTINLSEGPTNGTIDLLNGSDHKTDLVIDGRVVLDGSGAVTLQGNETEITGDSGTLVNKASIIGAGHVGDGSALKLINDGLINADNANDQGLTIDTGDNTIVNRGTLEATGDGRLTIDSNVDNHHGELYAGSGGIVDVAGNVCGGQTVIAGGKVEFDAKADTHVTFDNGCASAPTYGEMILGANSSFHGQISGFAGTDFAHSDRIELVGFNETCYSERQCGDNTILTLHDDGKTVTLTFDDFHGQLCVTTDCHGDTIITDPPAAAAATPQPAATAGASSSAGAAAGSANSAELSADGKVAINDDQFTFSPSLGNGSALGGGQQTQELTPQHTASIAVAHELATLTTPEPHIDFAHHDDPAPAALSVAQVHEALATVAHLH